MNKWTHAIGYPIAQMVYFMRGRDPEVMNRFYRKGGVQLGNNCLICTPLPFGSEAQLLTIKDDVVVSTNVTFVLHDFSISRVIKGKSNLYGKITIGNNCFIGTNSILLYGVELADNIIVAAGSVVTKSFSESNIIIGGNPARKIGTWDEWGAKSEQYGQSQANLKDLIDNHPEFLVKR